MTQPLVYLDHAATTPMLPAAVEAMTRQLTGVGNASSLHASGRGARRVVEESRETIAGVIGARPGDVVFTSGGTESDNLALKGIFWARRAEDPRRSSVHEDDAGMAPLQRGHARHLGGRIGVDQPMQIAAASQEPLQIVEADLVVAGAGAITVVLHGDRDARWQCDSEWG